MKQSFQFASPSHQILSTHHTSVHMFLTATHFITTKSLSTSTSSSNINFFLASCSFSYPSRNSAPNQIQILCPLAAAIPPDNVNGGSLLHSMKHCQAKWRNSTHTEGQSCSLSGWINAGTCFKLECMMFSWYFPAFPSLPNNLAVGLPNLRVAYPLHKVTILCNKDLEILAAWDPVSFTSIRFTSKVSRNFVK